MGIRHDTAPADTTEYRTYSTGHIHSLARQAYRRSLEDEERDVRPDDALTAVILSVASLEALVNDLFDMAGKLAPRDHDLRRWSRLWPDLERLNVGLKYLIVAQAIGEPFDKTRQPYQDFSLLVAVRNEILHYKSPATKMKLDKSGVTFTYPKLVKRLVARKVIPKPRVSASLASLLEHVKSASVARWACNTAAKVARHVVDNLPKGTVRRLMMEMTREMKPIKAYRPKK